MRYETETQKIARLSSRRYTKAQLARLLVEGDRQRDAAERRAADAEAAAQRATDTVHERLAAERRGIHIDRVESGWEVAIHESGQPALWLEVPTHDLLMEIVAALSEEETPTAVDGLTALAVTGDTSIGYRLPYVPRPDTSGPWGKDEMWAVRAARKRFLVLKEELDTAPPAEYPALWARATVSAHYAHEKAPALLQQHEGE